MQEGKKQEAAGVREKTLQLKEEGKSLETARKEAENRIQELLVQIPMRLGATGITPGAISLKFLALFFYLVSVVLIGWAAGRGGQAAAGTLA